MGVAFKQAVQRLRGKKTSVYIAAGLGGLLVLFAAAGIVVGSSERALRWAATKAVAGSGGALVLEGVRGSTFSGASVERLRYGQTGAVITAQQASLRWSPLALLWGTIKFTNVRARYLSVALPPPSDKIPTPPQHLRPPIRIALTDISVDRLDVVRAGRTYPFETVVGDIVLGKRRWHWQLDAARSFAGRTGLDFKLGAQKPFDLDGSMTVERREKPAYKLALGAAGSLLEPRITLSGNGNGATLNATAGLAPFAFNALTDYSVDLKGVNPRAWQANLPEANLALTGNGKANGDTLQGGMTLLNSAPGTLDVNRMPLRRIDANIMGATRDLRAPTIVADLGPAGRLSGSASARPGAVEMLLNTTGLDLKGFKTTLEKTSMAGTVALTTEGVGQRYRIDLNDPRYGVRGDFLHANQRIEFNSARLRARGAEFNGRGRLALSGQKTFDISGAIARLNPAEFGKKAPKGSLAGTVNASGQLSPQLDSDVRFNIAKSTLAGQPAEARGTLSTRRVNNRLDLAIKASARVGATRASAEGSFVDPARLQKLRLTMTLSGDDLGKLYNLLNIPLPPTPPYRLAGMLIHENKVWQFDNFKGVVGNSDLAGDFSVDHSRAQKFMRGDLISRNLDLKDLGGFVGADTKPDAVEKVPGRGVLPRQRFNLSKLHAADADIRFRGAHIKTRRLPLDDMTAHLKLDRGKLTLEPLNFGVAGGNIVSTIAMDANVKNIETRADVRARQLELSKLFPGFNLTRASAGAIGGAAKVAGRGNSVAEILGSMNGDVALVMNGGSLSELLLRLANLDIQHTAKVLLTGDRQIPVRCMVADFKAVNGVLTTESLVLDSGKENIIGSGTINLREELLDLKLVAHPKDTSFVALRGPILIQGSFEKPAVRPQMGGVIARSVLAAALGSIAGPLGLIPLIDLGNAQNHDCDGLMAEAKKIATPKRAPAS